MRSDDPESVRAVADCPWLGIGPGTRAERAANYVREREKLLQALKPGSPERLFFVATFPESYDVACMTGPNHAAPTATHAEASNAVH
jgi:hypothetical protein